MTNSDQEGSAPKPVQDEKIAIEYLKILLDREAKENDRILTRNAVFVTLNAAAVGTLATLLGKTDVKTPYVMIIIGFTALMFDMLWYQLLTQSKLYQYYRQKDVVDFIISQGLRDIFKAEGYSADQPDRLLPGIVSIGSTHVMAISAIIFSMIWLLIAAVGLTLFFRN